VRRQEQKERPELNRSRYIWLKNKKNLKASQRKLLDEESLTRLNLKTARAYRMRLAFKEFFSQPMGSFLSTVSKRHPDEFITMVVDAASSERALQLSGPNNLALVRLPPYSPELNPVDHLWDELREKKFANRVFDTLGAAIAQAARGLKRIKKPAILQSIVGWDWILRSL